MPAAMDQRVHENEPAAANSYLFGDNDDARRLFNTRRLATDGVHLLPYLRQGMRVVDCGCGAGSMTMAVAERVAPGEVLGFDINESAIEHARRAAADRKLGNVHFEIASVFDNEFANGSFDLFMCTGVLAHLERPDKALAVAGNLLKPGGIVYAQEPAKSGDWFAGPNRDAIEEINNLIIESWVARGADPDLGMRLGALLRRAGFESIRLWPSYSHALSRVEYIGAYHANALAAESGLAKQWLDSGKIPRTRKRKLIDDVTKFSQDETSIAAHAEVTAIAYLPNSP